MTDWMATTLRPTGIKLNRAEDRKRQNQGQRSGDHGGLGETKCLVRTRGGTQALRDLGLFKESALLSALPRITLPKADVSRNVPFASDEFFCLGIRLDYIKDKIVHRFANGHLGRSIKALFLRFETSRNIRMSAASSVEKNPFLPSVSRPAAQQGSEQGRANPATAKMLRPRGTSSSLTMVSAVVQFPSRRNI